MTKQATERNQIPYSVGLRLRDFRRMAGRSRVNREVHVRICGGVRKKEFLIKFTNKLISMSSIREGIIYNHFLRYCKGEALYRKGGVGEE